VLGYHEEEGAYSSYYGRKKEAPQLVFSTTGTRITTRITLLKTLPEAHHPDQPLDE
jgi:hypothetical protein